MHKTNRKENIKNFLPYNNNITNSNCFIQNQNLFDNKTRNSPLKNNLYEKNFCNFNLNNNNGLRNRLIKQCSASPQLIKKSTFQQVNTPQSPFNKANRSIPLTNVNLLPTSLFEKRSSLLFFPNLQSVDKNIELLLPEKNNNKINMLNDEKINNKKLNNFDQIEDKTNIEKFVKSNNTNDIKSFDKDINKKLIINNNKNKELIQIDISSSESLPLDVSRYDNVVPEKNQSKFIHLKIKFLFNFFSIKYCCKKAQKN